MTPEFEKYIIRKMYSMDGKEMTEITTETRYTAYRSALSRMGEDRVASLQTMQKWFGIHGSGVPGREALFHLGLTLGFSEKEIRECLRCVLQEPDFQVNDYRELIFLYGYRHGKSYKACLSMIEQFEDRLPLDIEIRQRSVTHDIEENYEKNCDLGEADFLNWMEKYREDFKGYSMTVLEYFKILKMEILQQLQCEARVKLTELLMETDFFLWRGKKKENAEISRRDILRYLRSAGEKIPKDLQENILEMRDIAYVSLKSNKGFLEGMYASRSDRQRFRLMNGTRLSNLLNVAEHKERQIRLSVLYSQLKRLDKKSSCPKWSILILEEYGCSFSSSARVSDAMDWISRIQKDYKRRCYVIHRCDLLPMILCVAQKRYSRELEAGGEYEETKARAAYRKLADKILTACQMEPLSPEKYEMDRIFYECYQEHDMYSLAEILEE